MKKEFYRHRLPHFQQPGQAYFITWSLKDAIPKKALKRYSDQLEIIQSNIRWLQNYTTKMSDSEIAPPLGPVNSDSSMAMSGLESAPPRGPANSDSPIQMSDLSHCDRFSRIRSSL